MGVRTSSSLRLALAAPSGRVENGRNEARHFRKPDVGLVTLVLNIPAVSNVGEFIDDDQPRSATMQRLLIFGIALSLAAASGNAQLSGTLTSVGSDTMRELMTRWVSEFTQAHPGLTFDIQARGSGTAAEALIQHRSNLAPMSRMMSSEEVAAFQQSHGYEPARYRVALDALAIFVHADNPVRGLSMDQVDSIFSEEHRCHRGFFSDSGHIDDWSDVTFNYSGAIELYGRNELSGTHDFFVEMALCNGKFKQRIVELADSRSIVDAVAANPNAIGYAGIGYRTEGVKALALSSQASTFEGAYYSYYVEQYRNDEDLERRYGWVVRGRYPLSRYLYIYTDEGGDHADANVRAFMKFVLWESGQALTHDSGFIPLPRRVLEAERELLQDG